MDRPGGIVRSRRGSVRVVGLLAALAVAVPTAGCAADKVEYRDDRGDITQLIYRFYADTTEGKFDDLNKVLTEGVVVTNPGGGLTEGREKVIAGASEGFKTEDRVQELVSNVLIDLNGDKAKVRADVVQLFGSSVTPKGKIAPEPALTLNSRMRFEATRDSQGWRLSRIEGDVLWAVDKPAAAPAAK
ncbi:nuclear transport factor 2 family protein [Micromonospora rifamycinica]|uniref:nuclear transport factor 2 family protein n=1 Tax=Micromonospora rifamycinica TaxID=291594 RepID=UPI0033EE3CB2